MAAKFFAVCNIIFTQHPSMPSEYFIKYGALALLVVQNAAVALVTSHSRTSGDGPKFLSTTAGERSSYWRYTFSWTFVMFSFHVCAVVNIELIKFVICHLVVWYNDDFSIKKTCSTLASNLAWKEILLISVPAFVYTIQNNLIFVALEYLDPTTFQLCYQVHAVEHNLLWCPYALNFLMYSFWRMNRGKFWLLQCFQWWCWRKCCLRLSKWPAVRSVWWCSVWWCYHLKSRAPMYSGGYHCAHWPSEWLSHSCLRPKILARRTRHPLIGSLLDLWP